MMYGPIKRFGPMCCICFTHLGRAQQPDIYDEDKVWECPRCHIRWDVCRACGEREGCLDCNRDNNIR